MRPTTSTTTVALPDLFATLQGRERPETVAQLILALQVGRLDRSTRQALERAAKGGGWGSLMATSFAAPADLTGPVTTLATLLEQPALGSAASSPRELRRLLAVARTQLAMAEGRSSFKYDRANREQRKAAGLELSRRRYNKLFRLVARLERETLDLERQWRLFELGRVAKTVFAAAVPWEAFSADLDTACATAYLSANLGRRSEFTNGPQARALDTVAERLLERCAQAPPAGWLALAHVFPRADVLARVEEADRLVLLERALATLRECAELLRMAWTATEINLQTMIVRPGNDSSTWNALAGAWNKARDVWIALMQSLGYEDTFERFLPGKVLRLMAADVAVLHQLSGGRLHPDTHVWAALPRPWEVMAGEAVCTKAMIETACRAHGVDPVTSGWIAPRPHTVVEPWRPTPELVHGVTVNQPELAFWLRKVGVFSGQELKLDKQVRLPTDDAGAR
jgi:hypothetical protein